MTFVWHHPAAALDLLADIDEAVTADDTGGDS